MQNITVQRYDEGVHGFQGYIEPEDLSWILFIEENGEPLLWPRRDADGGVIGEPLHL